MSVRCELVTVILVLTLIGQVQAAQIYGGREAVPHSRPYMVLLERKLVSGKNAHCDGFLVSEDFVMTAAHCQTGSITAILGVHSVFQPDKTERVTVEQKFPHEDYNSTTYRHDIMLLKLSSKVHFWEHVKPIQLAGRDGSVPKSCIVSGWGRTQKDMNGIGSPLLMEVNVTLVEKEDCEKEKCYCSEGESGPRPGDSGGPLVCEDGMAHGIVSRFKSNMYFYISIPDLKDWMILTMKKAFKMP